MKAVFKSLVAPPQSPNRLAAPPKSQDSQNFSCAPGAQPRTVSPKPQPGVSHGRGANWSTDAVQQSPSYKPATAPKNKESAKSSETPAPKDSFSQAFEKYLENEKLFNGEEPLQNWMSGGIDGNTQGFNDRLEVAMQVMEDKNSEGHWPSTFIIEDSLITSLPPFPKGSGTDLSLYKCSKLDTVKLPEDCHGLIVTKCLNLRNIQGGGKLTSLSIYNCDLLDLRALEAPLLGTLTIQERDKLSQLDFIQERDKLSQLDFSKYPKLTRVYTQNVPLKEILTALPKLPLNCSIFGKKGDLAKMEIEKLNMMHSENKLVVEFTKHEFSLKRTI